jgi:hypothetical protein
MTYVIAEHRVDCGVREQDPPAVKQLEQAGGRGR